MEQIRNPTTNRLINVGGTTYNDLIKYGEYTQKYLSSLPTIKKLDEYDMEDIQFTGIDDTDIHILSFLDDESLVDLCQTNLRLNQLCKKDRYLTNRVDQYLLNLDNQFNIMKYRIGKAILADRDKKGSTRQAIKKYLSANFIFNDHELLNKTIKILLERTTGERLIKNKHHGGHYKLSAEFKKALQD